MDELLPDDLLEDLRLGHGRIPDKVVNVIFDKSQAIIRIPTVFNDTLELFEDRKPKCRVSLIEGEPLSLKLEFIKNE